MVAKEFKRSQFSNFPSSNSCTLVSSYPSTTAAPKKIVDNFIFERLDFWFDFLRFSIQNAKTELFSGG